MRIAFQPIYDIQEQRIIGYESLMRPNGQPPLSLLQKAQRQGRVIELDSTARRIAVNDAKKLLKNGQLLFLNSEPESLERIELWDPWPYAMEPSNVVIEVTERSMSEGSYPACDYLHQIGVQIALDDFGVGTSNLWMVDRFKPDFVKADRSFLGTKSKGNALEALVSMTGIIEAKLIVEGVESAKDVEYLKKIGVKYAQGFHLGKPLFIDSLLASSLA